MTDTATRSALMMANTAACSGMQNLFLTLLDAAEPSLMETQAEEAAKHFERAAVHLRRVAARCATMESEA